MQNSPSLTPAQQALVADIAGLRQRILALTVELIESAQVEQPGQWSVIVNAALGAGLTHEEISREFSCSVSTVRRWAGVQSSPARSAAKAIRIRLVEMLRGHSLYAAAEPVA